MNPPQPPLWRRAAPWVSGGAAGIAGYIGGARVGHPVVEYTSSALRWAGSGISSLARGRYGHIDFLPYGAGDYLTTAGNYLNDNLERGTIAIGLAVGAAGLWYIGRPFGRWVRNQLIPPVQPVMPPQGPAAQPGQPGGNVTVNIHQPPININVSPTINVRPRGRRRP